MSPWPCLLLLLSAVCGASDPHVVTTLHAPQGGNAEVLEGARLIEYVYDQLDRLVRATDNAGQTSRFAYDSRDNLITRTDAEGALTADPLGLFPGQINGPGNSKTYVYDGLDRLLREVCDLRVGGVGGGALDTSNAFNPDGQVTVAMEYDGNSRLAARIDDAGNRTTYSFDALNRQIRATLADATFHEYTFDRDSNLVTSKDPNGTTTTTTFDALNRATSSTVQVLGSGVQGPVLQTYAYDGLSRLTRATDDNGGAGTHVIERVYDSLSRGIEERQDGQAVSSVFTGDSKRLRCTYPGGRSIEHGFDLIDRIKTIRDTGTTGTPIAALDYIGPGGRELRRTFANGTKNTFLNASETAVEGYDAVQRVTRMRSVGAGGGVIVDFEYAYNRASQRTLERRHHESGLTDRYSYDSLYRLTQVDYDQDNAVVAARDLRQASWAFDGVGNRREEGEVRTSTPMPTTTTYQIDALNQYTQINSVIRAHSNNGNVREDEKNLYRYDSRDRLVEVRDRASGDLRARYQYDPSERRVTKEVFAGGAVADATIRYFYDGWQCVEELRSGSLAGSKTYVHG